MISHSGLLLLSTVSFLKVTVIPKCLSLFFFFVIVIIVYIICLCCYFSLNMLISVFLIFIFLYSTSFTSRPILYSCNCGGIHLQTSVWFVHAPVRYARKRCTDLLCIMCLGAITAALWLMWRDHSCSYFGVDLEGWGRTWKLQTGSNQAPGLWTPTLFTVRQKCYEFTI